MVWLIGRRFGKSYTLCILALEQCIRKPNSIIKFLSPTKDQVNKNVRPILREILEDCPADIVPVFSQKDMIYYFPNGSEIQLAGSDKGNAIKLRGGDSDIAFVDEAGSCTDLEKTVNSVLLPTTLKTKGKVILASTPPEESDHEFFSFIEQASTRGTLIKKTTFSNPLLSKEEIELMIEASGGINSDSVRREIFCEVKPNPKSVVIPEFTDDMKQEIVKECIRPAHYDSYEALDLGYKDLTVALFAYFDFRNNKVVIEDEFIFNFQSENQTIGKLIKGIQDKEKDLYFNQLTNELHPVTRRVSDIDLIVINEMKKMSNYQLNFEPTTKDHLEAMVNYLREKIKKREIMIHPRCKTLIRHLENCKWKKGQKAEFARSPDDGHYDAVAALTYLIRAIDYRKNPYPYGYGYTQKDLFGNIIAPKMPRQRNQEKNDEMYKSLFNIKGKK